MPWDHVWIDVHIATMDNSIDNEYGIINNAAIAIKDGKIAWLGLKAQLPKFDVFPSLFIVAKEVGLLDIDSHTHLIFAVIVVMNLSKNYKAPVMDIAANGGNFNNCSCMS